MLSRPRFHPYPTVTTETDPPSGYRYSVDIRAEVSGLGFPGIVATIAWNAEKTLIKGTTNVQTKITGAAIYVYQVGFGWAKMNEVGGNYMPYVTYNNRVIRFEKRFLLEISTNPVFKAIPLLGETDGGNRWIAEIEGTYDIISGVSFAQFSLH